MIRQTSGQRWCSLVLLAVLISLSLFHGGPELLFLAGRAWESGRQAALDPVAGVPQFAEHQQAEVVRRVSEPVRPAVVRVEAIQPPGAAHQVLAADAREATGTDRTTWGCGVIIDRAGLVLTNFDPIADATAIRIHLPDERGILAARLVAGDADTDLALLRIDAPPADLPAAELSDGHLPGVGDPIFVVGHATHRDQFLWVGTVLDGGRLTPASACGPQDFIQTSAANLWNLGGPLLNLQGQVVGITTTWVELGDEGHGLAVPATVARQVVDELAAHGRVARGWLGLFLHAVDPMPEPDSGERRVSAAVDFVVPDSPAAKAGVRRRDLIVRVGGRPFAGLVELRRRIAVTAPESRLELSLIRGGESLEPSAVVALRPPGASVLPGEREWGMRPMCHVPPELEESLRLEADQGVVVQAVTAACRSAGLQPGDVLVAVDGEQIRNLDELCRAVCRWRDVASPREARLSVRSQGNARVVVIAPPQHATH